MSLRDLNMLERYGEDTWLSSADRDSRHISQNKPPPLRSDVTEVTAALSLDAGVCQSGRTAMSAIRFDGARDQEAA